MATVGQRNNRKQIAQQRAVQPDVTLGSVLLTRQRDDALRQVDRACAANATLYTTVGTQRERIQDQQHEIAALRSRPTWGSVFVYSGVVGVLAIGSYFV